MTPERWAQIEELFHRAAECDPGNRAVLLDKACDGDSELRHAVESLLANEKEAGDHVHAMVRTALEGFSFPLIGQIISHYRILNGIGGGGMGLVYRAEDIRLKRQVALKFLPEHSAKDPAALGRFEREAHSASALEHPNICPIYEFGEHEGRSFIVMQLLEGETLSELLSAAPKRKSPFTLERLLELGIQIADGLAAAHERGIIHRDIKPANIFVTNKGQAKILDFGLAKPASVAMLPETSIESDDPPGDKSHALIEATPSALLSQTGAAMGTPRYMSPEQTCGEKLDVRTDVFSLGLVLYEMATGQRAFKGRSEPVLRDATVTQVPTSVCELNPALPTKLDRIIHKALEKDKQSRYQSAAEIRVELQNLKRATEHKFHWREWAAGALALLLVAASLFWYFERRRSSVQAPPELNMRQLTFNSFENPVISAAISPDGKYLAYSDLNGMYIQLIETGTIQTVPWPEGLNSQNTQWEIIQSAWFPDGRRFIANVHPAFQATDFWNSETTSVWVVSALGGAPRKLRDRGMAWAVSPGGSVIAYGKNKSKTRCDREIWLMTPYGVDEHKVLESDADSGIGVFQWIPGSSRFSYSRFDDKGETAFTADLNGGPSTLLFPASEIKEVNSMIWLRGGRVLYPVRENEGYHTCNFWTRRIDLGTGQFIEKPSRLTNWLGSCMDFMSLTADGNRLSFMKITQRLNSYLADVSAAVPRLSNVRHFPESESSEGIADWTPDGKEMIVQSNRASDYFGLYRQPLNEESAVPLDTKGFRRSPCATPDGKWILYLGYGGTELGWWEEMPLPVLRIPITGGAPTTLFSARPETFSLTCARPPAKICALDELSEDGKYRIVSTIDPMTGRGPELARFPISPDRHYWWAQLSPDGTRIAMAGNSQPIHIILLRDHTGWDLNVQGWHKWYKPSWAADGKGLYVSAADKGRNVILYLDLQGNSYVVWEAPKATQEIVASPSPDGRHLAIQIFTENDNMWSMESF